jgi:23S rRNA (cytosine1962-C5)-methyltransferase
MEGLFPLIRPLLEERLNPACIVARNDVHFRELEGLEQKVEILLGEPDPDLTVTYEGLQVAVDLMGGQKTGLFLDQRDNQRTLLSDLARGEVLDCFCYQGIWGLLALQAGAEKVTGIDSSLAALDYAARHARDNNLTDKTEWIKGDVVDVLKEFRSRGKVFDVVVLDPPSYVKSRKHVKAGLRGYLDLNRKAMDVVAPGGVLITCSCSHHVRPEVFTDTVGHAAGLVSRHVRLLGRGGQSKDHPPLITALETDYLKCLALQID